MTGTPEAVTRDAMMLAVKRQTITMEEIRGFFDGVYSAVARVLAQQDAGPVGPAVAVYYRFDPAADVVDVAAGFPAARPITAQDDVVPLELPETRVARYEHHGSYDELGEAHARLIAWITEQGWSPGVPFVETYVTQPAANVDPADMVTRVEYPLEGRD